MQNENTQRKQERQDGKQDLGKTDTPSNTKEKALRTPNSTLLAEKCDIKPPARKGNNKRDKLGDKLRQGVRKTDTPSNTGKQEGRQWEKGETRPREGGHTIQQKETIRKTINGRQGETRRQDLKKGDTPSNNKTDT